MKLLLVLIFLFPFFAQAQVTCVATSGTCSVADPSKSSGCRVDAGARCTVSIDGVCKAIVQSMATESRLVSANVATAGNNDWQTFMATLNGFTASPCNCDFNGTPVPDGTSVTAYQSSNVPYGSTCVQQQRTCNAGVLSESYTFSSCTVDPGSNCSAVDGVALNHTQSATFYLRACEDFGNTCSGQTRTCTNGTLSGTYTNASCSVVSGSSCTLDGQTVASGSGRYFYNTTSVPYGNSCDTATYRQYRNCSNGVLDGSASFNRASCSTAAAVGCTKDGVSRAHGGTATFYQAATAATCTGESQTCNNGTWSPNTYQYASCTVASTVTCYYNLDMYTAVSCGEPLINCNPGQSQQVADAAACAALCDLCPTASMANKSGCTTSGPTTCGAPAGADCASVTKNWTVGGQTCQASTGVGTHLQNKQINDTLGLGEPTGSASFVCNNGTWAASPSASPAPTCAEATGDCYCDVKQYFSPYPTACELDSGATRTMMGSGMTSNDCSNLQYCPATSVSGGKSITGCMLGM